MSESAGIKEPHYFFDIDSWLSRKHPVTSWSQYMRLFCRAPLTVKYLGEASTSYLQSEVAVPNILYTCSTPRFIVMFRNPVDLVVSLHNQRLISGHENVGLEDAWRLQDERMEGRSLPPGILSGRYVLYRHYAMLGMQLERLLNWVGRNQVHWIFHEDFKRDPAASYHYVLNFLGLPDDGRKDFDKFNPSRVFRWQWIERGLTGIRRTREHVGLPGGFGINALINRFNTIPGEYSISEKFRNELGEYFSDDVALLEKLTGRDLASWLKPQDTNRIR